MIISSQPANLPTATTSPTASSTPTQQQQEGVASDCNCVGAEPTGGGGLGGGGVGTGTMSLMMGRTARQAPETAAIITTATTAATPATTGAATTMPRTTTTTTAITSRASLTRPASESELLVGKAIVSAVSWEEGTRGGWGLWCVWQCACACYKVFLKCHRL